jgi:hypothetical protein
VPSDNSDVEPSNEPQVAEYTAVDFGQERTGGPVEFKRRGLRKKFKSSEPIEIRVNTEAAPDREQISKYMKNIIGPKLGKSESERIANEPERPKAEIAEDSEGSMWKSAKTLWKQKRSENEEPEERQDNPPMSAKDEAMRRHSERKLKRELAKVLDRAMTGKKREQQLKAESERAFDETMAELDDLE